MRSDVEGIGNQKERYNKALGDMALQMSRDMEELSLRTFSRGGVELLTRERLAWAAAERKNLDALTAIFSALPEFNQREDVAISLLAKVTLRTARWLLENFFHRERSSFWLSSHSLLSAAVQTEERERGEIILSALPEGFCTGGLVGFGAEDILRKVLRNPVAVDLFFPRFMGINERIGKDDLTPLLMLFIKESDALKGLDPSYSKESFFRTASLLIKKGADMGARDKDGRTVLMQCLKSPEGMRFLLANGADPDATDALGMTALTHLSASGGAATNADLLENMEVLLSTGADPFIRDDFGKGFLSYLIMKSRGVLPRTNKEDNSRWFRIASEVFLAGVLEGKESPGELLPESPEHQCPPAERGALMLSALVALSCTLPSGGVSCTLPSGGASSPLNTRDSEELIRKTRSELRTAIGKVLHPAMSRILGFDVFPHFVSEAGLLKTLSGFSFPGKGFTFTPPRSRRLLEIMLTALESDEMAVFEFLARAGGTEGRNFKSWLNEARKAGTDKDADTLIPRLAGRLRGRYSTDNEGMGAGDLSPAPKSSVPKEAGGKTEIPWHPVVF